MGKKKVVTFGEIMLRLSPHGYLRLIQADSMAVSYGGAEANVAVSLANFGLKSCFVSKLPRNALGQAAENHLRRFGAETKDILWGGERLGIYFAETGASQRASLVVYDRAGSAVAQLKPGDISWEEIFSGKDWFHFTGITPALGDGPAGAVLEAAKKAREAGLTVSCDLNYRQKLWSPEKAERIMSGLMPYVDVLIGNEEDAENVFGIKAKDADITAAELSAETYSQVAEQLLSRFALQKVAITLRKSYSASDNGWSAILYDGSQTYKSHEYKVHLVDRVGGGDSFCAGLIYGLLSDMAVQGALEFAVAASCLKQTIPGDFNLVSVAEVEKLVAGDASGRVQR